MEKARTRWINQPAAARSPKQKDSPFLAACRGENSGRIPVWFMRQAGRCIPEYRALREKYDILTICRTPELAAEVTAQPVRALGVDAAIIFADIVLLFPHMGFSVEMKEGVGPMVGNPIKCPEDVARISLPREEDFSSRFSFLAKAISLAREKVSPVPLIGFAGAPFTLAVFLLDGRAKKDAIRTKMFFHSYPEVWHALMEKISDAVTAYLRVQIKAGADAVELFDSFVGCLSAKEYERFVLPYSLRIFEALREEKTPTIHYGAGTAPFLAQFSSVPCDVVGIDSKVDIADVFRTVGEVKSIQGNLDPNLLLSDFSSVRGEMDKIFQKIEEIPSARERFIFNIGGGILPDTPLDTLKRVADYAHER